MTAIPLGRIGTDIVQAFGLDDRIVALGAVQFGEHNETQSNWQFESLQGPLNPIEAFDHSNVSISRVTPPPPARKRRSPSLFFHRSSVPTPNT